MRAVRSGSATQEWFAAVGHGLDGEVRHGRPSKGSDGKVATRSDGAGLVGEEWGGRTWQGRHRKSGSGMARVAGLDAAGMERKATASTGCDGLCQAGPAAMGVLGTHRRGTIRSGRLRDGRCVPARQRPPCYGAVSQARNGWSGGDWQPEIGRDNAGKATTGMSRSAKSGRELTRRGR